MISDESAAPTVEEYAARMRFLHRCLEEFVIQMRQLRSKNLYFQRTAPKRLADAYYTIAKQMRAELKASTPIAEGDDRRRIDRHKIAAGLLKTINALRPIRVADDLAEEQPGYNALFGYFVVVAFFAQWHKSMGTMFSLTPCGHAFVSANIWWLQNHQHDVPHQLMSQTLYLFEACCLLEADRKAIDDRQG